MCSVLRVILAQKATPSKRKLISAIESENQRLANAKSKSGRSEGATTYPRQLRSVLDLHGRIQEELG